MINYKGTPLFGQDSSVSHTSEFFAIAGTILFWLLFLIFSFVIKPQPKKPEYKEVQIVLSSTPVQKSEDAPAPAEAASASASAASESLVENPPVEAPAVESPVVETPAPKSEPLQKTVETPAPKKTEAPKPKAQTQPNKEAAKTQPAPQNTVNEQNFAPDLSSGVDFNSIPKKTNIDNSKFDEMFDDDEPTENTTPNQIQTVQNNEPAFSGSAGTATDNVQGAVHSQNSNNITNQNVSDNTKKSLNDIQNSSLTDY